MSDVFNGIGEGVANLFGAGPSGGPLGGAKGFLGPAVAAALNFVPVVGPELSAADFAAQAGHQLSNGNTLGGILDLGGGALSAAGGLGAFGGAGTGASAAATPAAGGGSTLADFSGAADAGAAGSTGTAAAGGGGFLSGVGNTIGNAATSAGNGISSAWDNVLNYFSPAAPAQGINPLAAGGGAIAGGAAPGSAAPFDLTASAGASPAANAAALGLTVPGADAGVSAAGTGGGGILNSISAFTKAHPLLTLGGGLVGSQLLSPLLQKITGSGETSQEKALLAAQQPAINAANELTGSEESGVLPPGAQASINQALASDIAQIKQRYASTGQSGSAAEATDIANAKQQSAANQFGLAQQATQTGLSALGLTDKAYETLVTDQLNRQQTLQNAFSGFFNALGVGTALANSKAA